MDRQWLWNECAISFFLSFWAATVRLLVEWPHTHTRRGEYNQSYGPLNHNDDNRKTIIGMAVNWGINIENT